MRNAVIDGKLQHLRVDHDQPALFRLQPVEQRQDHRVDGDRFARAGGAGDEQMRHAREVDNDSLAADGFTQRNAKPRLRFLEGFRREQFAQIDRFPPLVRQLNADGVAALHHSDARRQRAHRARDVIR